MCELFVQKFQLIILLLIKVLFVWSVSFDQCQPDDILFTKSRVGIEILNTTEITIDQVQSSQTASNCFSKCKKNFECKSAAFFDQSKSCHLKSISRLNITSRIKLSPEAQYFEKRECETDFESKVKFISLVKNAADCKDIYKKGWKMDGVYGDDY